jgi:hypothetical protein
VASAKLKGFAPDAQQQMPGVLTDCSALIPYENGFKAAPTPISAGIDALAAACRGAAVLPQLTGAFRTFAGTQTEMYELSGTTWADVTDASGDYTGSAESRWSFAQFGSTALIANINDPINYSTTSGAFDAIATAPKAKIIFTVAGFVMALHYNDGALVTDGWFHSGYQDFTVWTPAVATQCAKGRLFGTPGPFTAGIRFGEDALAFKANTIYLGRYAGPPNPFQWTEIPGQAGCVGQDALCDISTDAQPAVFFVGRDNFYIYDGARPVPVGVGQVREWFLSRINIALAYRTQAVYDRASRNVYIFYPNSTSSGTPNETLVYNVQTGLWGRDDREVEAVINFAAAGVTWHSLGTLYATWNDLPDIPYDSEFWAAGNPVFGYFNTSHIPQLLTGTAGSSSFTTGDFGHNEQIYLCSGVVPNYLQKPTTASLVNSYRMNIGDALSSDGAVSYSRNKFDVMRAACWHRYTFSQTGGMKIDSFEPKLKPVGTGQ